MQLKFLVPVPDSRRLLLARHDSLCDVAIRNDVSDCIVFLYSFAQVDKVFVDSQVDMEPIVEQGIRSSVASSILRRHATDLPKYLKQCEMFVWEVYCLRYRMQQGQGDDTRPVSERASGLHIEPHATTRTKRTSIAGFIATAASDDAGDHEVGITEEVAVEEDSQGDSDSGNDAQPVTRRLKI